MSATLKLTHKTIGAEVRRGTCDAVVDGTRAGTLEVSQPIDILVEAGRHTLQVRNGRNSSRTTIFDVAEADDFVEHLPGGDGDVRGEDRGSAGQERLREGAVPAVT